MEPDIKDGSLVFVDKSQMNINSTGVFIVNTSDGVLIKKIEVKEDRIVLKSTNKSFKDVEIVADEINVIGRVCGILVKI